MSRQLYMYVTSDEYEIPMAIGTLPELAKGLECHRQQLKVGMKVIIVNSKNHSDYNFQMCEIKEIENSHNGKIFVELHSENLITNFYVHRNELIPLIWTLDFDEKSKRIYGYGDDLNHDYGWDKQSDGFSKIEYWRLECYNMSIMKRYGVSEMMYILLADKFELSEGIVVGIMTASVSIITLIVGAIIEGVREKRRFRQERFMRTFDEKINAYKKFYAEILEYKAYFELFVDEGNEYKESLDPSEFGPLESNQKFRNACDTYSIYLSDKLKRLSYEALESGETLNTLALTLCNGASEMLESVAPSCENVISNLQKCVDLIKTELNI